MANLLSMAEIQTILTLHQAGQSNRQIAKLVGVHWETVAKYIAEAGENRPNSPTGSADINGEPVSRPARFNDSAEPFFLAQLQIYRGE